MAKSKNDERNETFSCPIARLISRFEKASRSRSKFMEHLSQSRIEFFKALKCLIDEKIEDLENKGVPRGAKKATRIKVE